MIQATMEETEISLNCGLCIPCMGDCTKGGEHAPQDIRLEGDHMFAVCSKCGDEIDCWLGYWDLTHDA